ncbi:MAG: CysB family HTH-type transcriptional regulator [Betaproteobacteria bacterium]|nr:CysB family HTH-type transcriptional regulator [Betaproteobacteria bacterium]
MNLQQLRAVRETSHQNFNLTLVAEALHTTQPAISRQIRELEQELGVELFTRRGKRLTGHTAAGAATLPIVERLLQEQANLRTAAADFKSRDQGELVVATTHTQARYALPRVVAQFRKKFPQVKLAFHQAEPQRIVDAVRSGEADIGIATESLARATDLLSFPCYTWNHVVVVPKDHPLARAARPTLADVALYPIVTYEIIFTGRPHIDEAFARAAIEPDIVLTALDSDVIKTYVREGLGIGIIAAMAFDARSDADLVALDAAHLFASNVTRLAIRRGVELRSYVYDFIELFAPTLTRATIAQALRVGATGEQAAYSI